MLRKFINKKLAENNKPLSELYSQAGISQNSYYWGLKKNSFNPDVIAKMAAFLKVTVDDINANIEKTGVLKTRKQRVKPNKLVKAGKPIKVIAEPVAATVLVKKARKPRKLKTAEIANPVLPEVTNIKKRGRKPRVAEPVSASVADNDMVFVQMELNYLKQMLAVKDELIELLKRSNFHLRTI